MLLRIRGNALGYIQCLYTISYSYRHVMNGDCICVSISSTSFIASCHMSENVKLAPQTARGGNLIQRCSELVPFNMIPP